MNRKSEIMNEILEMVLKCCAVNMGKQQDVTISKEDVLGKCRAANLVEARCLLVTQLTQAGFSTQTIATMMGKSTTAVRNLRKIANEYHRNSRAYRIIEEELEGMVGERGYG